MSIEESNIKYDFPPIGWKVTLENGSELFIPVEKADTFIKSYYEALRMCSGVSNICGIHAAYKRPSVLSTSTQQRLGHIFWVFDGENPDKSLGWFTDPSKAQALAFHTHRKGICRVTDAGELRVLRATTYDHVPRKTSGCIDPAPSELEMRIMYQEKHNKNPKKPKVLEEIESHVTVYWVYDGEKPDESMGWFSSMHRAQAAAYHSYRRGICYYNKWGSLKVLVQKNFDYPPAKQTGNMTKPVKK